MGNRTAVAFDEDDLAELERIVLDRDAEAALEYLRRVVRGLKPATISELDEDGLVLARHVAEEVALAVDPVLVSAARPVETGEEARR